MTTRLTDALLRRLAPGTEVRDSTVQGLVVRKRDETASYIFTHKSQGKVRKITLGRWPGLSIDKARDQARALRGAVQSRETPTSPLVERVDDLLDRYLDHIDKQEVRTAKIIRRTVDRDLRPELGAMLLTSLRRVHVQGLVDRAKTVSIARRTGNQMRTILRWGLRRGFLEADPTAALDLPRRGAPRARVLSDAELVAVLTPPSHMFDIVVQLLLLTGCRRNEIAHLRWDEIRDGMIHLPADRTKSARAHVVPLSTEARRMLSLVKRGTSPYVFPGRGGKAPIEGFTCLHESFQKRTSTGGWTLHDLRRTCATGLQRLDVPPHVIDRILNHADGALRRTYMTADLLPQCAEALEQWGRHLAALRKAGTKMTKSADLAANKKVMKTKLVKLSKRAGRGES